MLYPKLRPSAATKIINTEMMNILNPVLDTRQSSSLRHIFHTHSHSQILVWITMALSLANVAVLVVSPHSVLFLIAGWRHYVSNTPVFTLAQKMTLWAY